MLQDIFPSLWLNMLLCDTFWFCVFHILYAAEQALVRRFFDAAILLDRRLRTLVFERQHQLQWVWTRRYASIWWQWPTNSTLQCQSHSESVRIEELADNADAGGDVHMRLLTPIGKTRAEFWFRASSTRKTVVHANGVQLYVATGNVLLFPCNLQAAVSLHSQF